MTGHEPQKPPKKTDKYGARETKRRMDDALRRALTTPKKGKPSPAKAKEKTAKA